MVLSFVADTNLDFIERKQGGPDKRVIAPLKVMTGAYYASRVYGCSGNLAAAFSESVLQRARVLVAGSTLATGRRIVCIARKSWICSRPPGIRKRCPPSLTPWPLCKDASGKSRVTISGRATEPLQIPRSLFGWLTETLCYAA